MTSRRRAKKHAKGPAPRARSAKARTTLAVAPRVATPARDLIRFAVVGAGHIAQNAVIPAFAHARKDCVLTTLFSDDETKRRVLSKRYKIEHAFPYQRFDEACRAGFFDAVYIALPNHLHRDYAVLAADAGIHVLCEKPMAVTSSECRDMLDAARRNDVRLMIAYRLHFERANLSAVEIVNKGSTLGEPRFFNSVFSMQVKRGNIRLHAGKGGGPLYDIGIYCLNASRYLFRAEPTEVMAMAARGSDSRFAEVEEAISVMLKYPGERLATFVCSFGAADASHFQVLGTKGDLRVDPAYGYQRELEHFVTVKDRTRRTVFPKRDQFAPELIYFSDCIRGGLEPEPGGREGLIDVMIIEAIQASLRTGKAVAIPPLPRDPPPDITQELWRPPAKKKGLVAVQAPHAP